MTRILIATAVDAERQAVLDGLARAHDGRDAIERFDVAVVGVGMAAAAAATAMRLATEAAAGRAYHLVVSAGIAGGFPGRAAIGDIVIGTASIAADLGAETPDGFTPVSTLGFGTERMDVSAELASRLADAMGPADNRAKSTVRMGAVLSVSTVTGSAVRGSELAVRHPNAIAEAMEGFGVACAAAVAGIPFAELRTVSNLVGPRDREAWRIPQALASLSYAAEGLSTLDG